MIQVYDFYKAQTYRLECYINKNITKVPEHFVDSSLKGFTGSFIVSAVCAKRNHLRAGLIGGVISLSGTAIDAVIRKVLSSITSYTNTRNSSDSEFTSAILSDAVKLSFVGTFCLSHASLQINKQASFILSSLLYLTLSSIKGACIAKYNITLKTKTLSDVAKISFLSLLCLNYYVVDLQINTTASLILSSIPYFYGVRDREISPIFWFVA